jgi:hypothetical protein
MSVEEQPGSYVVMFFRTKSGELRCRVTDVLSRESWIANAASDAWRLLIERRGPDTSAEASP